MSAGWERRVQQTRADVLAAVGEIIAESGLEGLTMRRLAERAGVAVATLYNQFGDRDGVIVAFVSAGLDDLEGRLEARPATAPIDTTRDLFRTLDDIVAADTDVWQPVFASLQAGTGGLGMGELGDRVIAYIEADLAKAAAAGVFAVEVDTATLARHIFISRLARLERWAQGVIDWDQYQDSSHLGLELILASVLAEPQRSTALGRSGVVASG
jgi:AcrR family transcriptional regulator